MTDVFQCLKLPTIKEVFPDELAWISRHRHEIAEKQSDWLLLLNSDKFSLAHLAQVKTLMDQEEKQKAQATSGASLTGSHRNY
jgi:hypothetical protein